VSSREVKRRGKKTSHIEGFTLSFSPFIIHEKWPKIKQHQAWLAHLGKFKKGKACIYVNKLEDIDLIALEKLIHQTMDYVKNTYTVL